MNRALSGILKAPAITEKATLVTEKAGQVVFKVDPRATKLDIKHAIESLLGAKVDRVRTVNYLGKPRRTRGRTAGRRRAWKKAYVTLAEGQTVDLLEKV